MKYINTPGFNRWAQRKQREMLAGIYDQVKDDIIDWNAEVSLPITRGTKRWRQFVVTLKSFSVMAQYEPPFGDEDPQFVGVAVKNRVPQGFAAPKGDLDIVLGDTYPLELEVMRIEDLDLKPYSAEMVVRAFDDTDSVAKVILDEFAQTARTSLNGVTAAIPFGGSARRIGSTILDKVIRLAGAPKQVGSHYTLFDVTIPRYWQRRSTETSWLKHKFIVFFEEDPDDDEKPYFEIYMLLVELMLLSDEAMSGTGVSVPGGSGQVKTDTRTEDEKPGDDEPGDDKPEDGESQDEKPEDERSGEDDEEPGG